MKPKDALIKDGKVPTKSGKGRMNAAQIARIHELVTQGWVIEGYSVKKTDSVNTAPVVEKDKAVAGKVIADVPDESRREEDWEAFIYWDGKPLTVGMREIDNLCGSSFTYCHCPKPTFNYGQRTDNVVYFKPRVKPLPNKRW